MKNQNEDKSTKLEDFLFTLLDIFINIIWSPFKLVFWILGHKKRARFAAEVAKKKDEIEIKIPFSANINIGRNDGWWTLIDIVCYLHPMECNNMGTQPYHLALQQLVDEGVIKSEKRGKWKRTYYKVQEIRG